MTLPVIDISLFTAGSDKQRCSFAKQLIDSLTEHGFVKICNHGLTSDAVNAMLAWNRRFFELPVDTKRKISYKGGSAPSRGYIGLGHEKTSRKSPVSAGLEVAPDVRESLDIGPPSDAVFPNVWLDEVDMPGFRLCVESYYATCRRVSMHIIQAIELGLGVPSGCLTERTTMDSSELRLNYYPSIDMQEFQTGNTRRAWPHTDVGLISLLLQDDVGGLEIEDRKDPAAFLPIVNTNNTDMVIGVADTLERWTNGVLRAGLHHVKISYHKMNEADGSVAARSSIVFFFKAHGATSAGPLSHFVSPQHPARYSEITALAYLQQVNSNLYSY